jgi:hypothetical protein
LKEQWRNRLLVHPPNRPSVVIFTARPQAFIIGPFVLRVRAKIDSHFGASAGRADARRRYAGDVVTSSRSGNAADARPPPRPEGLQPVQHLNSYHQLSADSAPERAAAKCEVIFARALMLNTILQPLQREARTGHHQVTKEIAAGCVGRRGFPSHFWQWWHGTRQEGHSIDGPSSLPL